MASRNVFSAIAPMAAENGGTETRAGAEEARPGAPLMLGPPSAAIRARYRDSASTPELLEANKPYQFTIDLWATSNVFLPGHRIRLEISSSHFPEFDRNLNTGEPFGEGIQWVSAQQTVFHQDDHASYVLLPVIPR